MTKKKLDHLFYVEDLVESVLRKKEITSRCGKLTKTFTREDFEDTTYRNACAECMGLRASDGDPISIRTKTDWTGLLERAYLAATATTYTVSTWPTYTWSGSYTIKPSTTTIAPPAA